LLAPQPILSSHREESRWPWLGLAWLSGAGCPHRVLEPIFHSPLFSSLRTHGPVHYLRVHAQSFTLSLLGGGERARLHAREDGRTVEREDARNVSENYDMRRSLSRGKREEGRGKGRRPKPKPRPRPRPRQRQRQRQRFGRGNDPGIARGATSDERGKRKRRRSVEC
jgi:hypothetical protein